MNNKLVDLYKILKQKNLKIQNNDFENFKLGSCYLYDLDAGSLFNSINIRGNLSATSKDGYPLQTFKSFNILYDNTKDPELLSYISVSNDERSISIDYAINDDDVYYFKNLDIDNNNFLPASNGNGKHYFTRTAYIDTLEITDLKEKSQRENTSLNIKQNNTGFGFSTSVNTVISNNKIFMQNKFPTENNNRTYYIDYSDIKFNTKSNIGNIFSFEIEKDSRPFLNSIENKFEFPKIFPYSKLKDDNDDGEYEVGDFYSVAFINKLDISKAILYPNSGRVCFQEKNDYVNPNNQSDNEQLSFNSLGITYKYSEDSENKKIYSSLINESEVNSQKYNTIKLEGTKIYKSESEYTLEYTLITNTNFNEYTNETSILSFGGAKYENIPNSFIFSEYGNSEGLEFDIHDYGDGEIRDDGIMHITADRLKEINNNNLINNDEVVYGSI